MQLSVRAEGYKWPKQIRENKREIMPLSMLPFLRRWTWSLRCLLVEYSFCFLVAISCVGHSPIFHPSICWFSRSTRNRFEWPRKLCNLQHSDCDRNRKYHYLQTAKCASHVSGIRQPLNWYPRYALGSASIHRYHGTPQMIRAIQRHTGIGICGKIK